MVLFIPVLNELSYVPRPYWRGECWENEDVELEHKGVKLCVKRCEKPFSDGVAGHVKLLSNKATFDEQLRKYTELPCLSDMLLLFRSLKLHHQSSAVNPSGR